MTEQEWLACTDPQSMLEFLRHQSQRKETKAVRRGLLPSRLGFVAG